MPRWDYVCTKCGRAEERTVNSAHRDRQWCECGYMLLRQPAAPAVKFKGKGWTPRHYGEGKR